MVKNKNRTYIAIDLKSFYASVECVDRQLDPMTTNLVVADSSRTEKTICLAVTPSLKAYGIPGRARLFEVVQKVKEINIERQRKAPGRVFQGSSSDDTKIKASPELAVDYIIAPPRMSHYIEWSTKIYHIYLKYIAPEDIHVYSIDEVFIDATDYLLTYQLTARKLASKMIQDILSTTGITATAGIGTNLYLCKIAMDIGAKHVAPDQYGVRIAELNETTYRQQLWNHRPIRDFWRVGRGYAKKLEQVGLFTMGDVARCSVGREDEYYNEGLLYKLFGVNAELLIDHAWGWESCTMADIKAYRPRSNSMGSGQVLQSPYTIEKARVVVQEMVDALALDLLDQKVLTDQLVLTVGYDKESLQDSEVRKTYRGAVSTDGYGRQIPKHAHGTANLGRQTSSAKLMMKAALDLYDRTVNDQLLVRRIYVTANHLIHESMALAKEDDFRQLNLFTEDS
ncbi:MAG TPA: DNA methylase, partial [Candidatus Merdenecus merdavium]|nr:DNA methylase [Candidatus Merdenecus merdavium]